MDTGSPSRTELAAALHRLRSTLARMRAEVELSTAPGLDRVREDLSEALTLLGDVESAAFALVRVLVLDDDERLAELTARSLRRIGYEAESAAAVRPLRPRELVVLDLGLAETLDPSARAVLKDARPIVVTGAADPRSRSLAADLDASDYLVKPVETEVLAAAIRRRSEAG